MTCPCWAPLCADGDGLVVSDRVRRLSVRTAFLFLYRVRRNLRDTQWLSGGPAAIEKASAGAGMGLLWAACGADSTESGKDGSSRAVWWVRVDACGIGTRRRWAQAALLAREDPTSRTGAAAAAAAIQLACCFLCPLHAGALHTVRHVSTLAGSRKCSPVPPPSQYGRPRRA